MLRCTLRLWRRSRSIKRRLLGTETPHWATDLYKGLKYLNVIELFPTVLAVLLAPDHFFRRRNLITKKRSFGVKSVYRSPVGFAARILTFLLGLNFLDKDAVRSTDIAMYVLGTFLSLPFMIPVVCLAFLTVGIPIRYLTNAAWTRGRSTTLLWLAIPVAPSTYLRFDWRSFFWSLFYFYGYLLTLAATTILVIATLLVFMAAISVLASAIADGDLVTLIDPRNWPFFPAFHLSIWFTFFVIWLFARLVVYPYVAILVACARPQTLLMFACRHYDIRGAVRNLVAALTHYRKHANKTIRSSSWIEDAKKLRLDVFMSARRLQQLVEALRREVRRIHPSEEHAVALLLRTLGWEELELSVQRAPRGVPAYNLRLEQRREWIRFPVVDDWDAQDLTAHLRRHLCVLKLSFVPATKDDCVHPLADVPSHERGPSELTAKLTLSITRARAVAEEGWIENFHPDLDRYLTDQIPLAFKDWWLAHEPIPDAQLAQQACDLLALCEEHNLRWNLYPGSRAVLREIARGTAVPLESTSDADGTNV
jgi:hypothetical protein